MLDNSALPRKVHLLSTTTYTPAVVKSRHAVYKVETTSDPNASEAYFTGYGLLAEETDRSTRSCAGCPCGVAI